jgi:hypothetical protein
MRKARALSPALVSGIFSIALAGLTVPVAAESLHDWYPSTVDIIEGFEGSSPTKVTDDFDAQGLSVGILQWTVASGSFRKLVQEVGLEKSRALAASLMPQYGQEFEKVIQLSWAKNDKAARSATLKLQSAAARKEVQQWLGSPEVRAAQEALVKQMMEDVLVVAKHWKKTSGNDAPLTFPEFIFFFDAAVQGGLGTFKDGNLSAATKLVLGGKHYISSGDLSIRREMLVNYLADWLSVEWSQAKNKKYYMDAKKNAKLLRANASRLTPSEIHLLFMKYVRASVGNTPYQLPYMNRGVIDILGQGYVNQTHYDFTDEYAKRKPLTN